MIKSLNFHPRTNTHHQWVLVALISIVGFVISLAIPVYIGAPLAIFFLVTYVQFMRAAVKGPMPWEEPHLVHIYQHLKRRFDYYVQPMMVGYHAGEPVYVRPLQMDFCEIYDRNGRLIGTEQEFDWSATDENWWPDKPHDLVIEFMPTDGKSMSFISWLRSPKLPETLPQEERDHPICTLLNGRAEGFVTNLRMIPNHREVAQAA